MNHTLQKIIASRPDLSEYVFHFTKGSSAHNTLVQILEEGKLKDIKGRGYIAFTEAPLLSLLDMFRIFKKYREPMYSPFGVGIPIKEFYDLGGRNVIYGKKDEINDIDTSIRWRFEDYDYRIHNYLWLREWRINLSELLISPPNCIVITDTIDQELSYTRDMGDIEFDGEDAYMDLTINWRSISLETINNLSINSKVKLKDHIDQQNIGAKEYASLGALRDDPNMDYEKEADYGRDNSDEVED